MTEKKTKIALLFLLLILMEAGSGCIGLDKASVSASTEGNQSGPEIINPETSGSETLSPETRRTNGSGAETVINDTNSSEESAKNITGTLIEDLESNNSKTRLQAIEALGEYGETEVVQALVRLLEDEDEEIQLSAVQALGKIGEPAADVLIEELESGDFNSYTQLALIKTGDKRTAETLKSLFEKRREASTQANSGTANESGKEMSEEMVLAVEAREKALRKKIVEELEEEELEGEERYGDEALIQALNAEKQDAQTYADIAVFERECIGLAGDNETEELLLALKSEHGCIRIAAAMALGEMKEERAVDELLSILGHDYDLVRSCVALSLGKIGDERATERLTQELKHSDNEWTRSCAALALGEIGSERPLTLLIQRLYDKEIDVRYSSILALGLIGNEKAVDPLLEIFETDGSGRVQDPMNTDTDILKNTFIALGELKSNKSEETLIKILNDEEEKNEIRTASAKVLGKIGSSRAVKALLSVAEDEKEDLAIRSRALIALGKKGDKETAEVLIGYMDDAKLRKSAEIALKDMGEAAVEPLIKAMESGNEDLKKEAAFLLMEIGDEQAIEPLIEAF